MKSLNYNSKYFSKHIIDILFVLGLFCVFAASSVILIIFGADIYKKIVSNMQNNFSERTCTAYITEKIHQSDEYDSIEITDFAGLHTLSMKCYINDTEYTTRLYEYNGYLYELFSRTDIELTPDAGKQVVALHDLKFEMISDNLIKISYYNNTSDDYDNFTNFYVSVHS